MSELDEEKLITIATCTTSAEAHIIKTKLQDNDIPTAIFDENIVNMNAFYSNVVEGVKVKIPESYYREATRLLNVENNDAFENDEHCPECKSGNTEYQKFHWLTILLSLLLLGFPLPYIKRTWICKDCNHKWKSKKVSIANKS